MLKLDGIKVDRRSAGDNNITIVAFTGSFSLDEEGLPKEDYTFSQIIYNDELYSANIEQCNRDFESFRNEVKEYAKKAR